MFKNTFQNGLLSIFYSCGANPLSIWDMEVNNGHIKRLTDTEVNSIVLEIVSTNVATTYITCPKNKQVLGIKLPFLVMIVKNLKRYFSFEITILDDKNMRRRFRISNFQSTTKIKPFCTSMPIGLSGGWNQIQFNLSDFTRRAYGSQFIETLRVQVHANTRIRRIYFCDRLYTEEELPQDYKLFLPMERKFKKGKKDEKKPEAAEAAKSMGKLPPPPPLEEAPPSAVPEPAPTEPPPAEAVEQKTEGPEEVAVVKEDQEESEVPTGEGAAPSEATEEPLADEPAEEVAGEAPKEEPTSEAPAAAGEEPASEPAETPAEEA